MFETSIQNHCNVWFNLWFKSYRLQLVRYSHCDNFHLTSTCLQSPEASYTLDLHFTCGVTLFPQLFLSIHLSPLSFPWWGLMRTLGGCESSGADWKCVFMCVKERNLTLRVGGGWWPLPLQLCVCMCVCMWWARPLDDYLQGSISHWIEPPLCITAGLSRTLRSQCMIHYPIRGRVTHPWVILSNPGAHAQPSRCSLH